MNPSCISNQVLQFGYCEHTHILKYNIYSFFLVQTKTILKNLSMSKNLHYFWKVKKIMFIMEYWKNRKKFKQIYQTTKDNRYKISTYFLSFYLCIYFF